MKLYAFSDFHLSGDPPTKPMDIFGENWKNHREKILSAWKETITAGDTVIMAGDISWATHLEDALSDLKTLSALPGRKIIVRGNHDYWWNTVSKMKRMTDNAFEFIFNSALSVENIALAGTRGWIPETSKKITEEDKVIILREQGRLERSLIEAEKFNCEKIFAILHYPPFDEQTAFTGISTVNRILITCQRSWKAYSSISHPPIIWTLNLSFLQNGMNHEKTNRKQITCRFHLR